MSDSGLLAGGHGGQAQARQKKMAVLVLGMHRSGTSALTRVFNLLGCSLPKTLMGQNSSNQAGHWESNVVCRLNDRILESAGSQWNDWLAFSPAWQASPRADEFRDEAVGVLASEFGAARLFVLKDPRICRLAPFWLDALEAFDAEPRIVLPLRNPLEVAASLAARDGIDPSIGHLLWLRHVLDAERATRGRPRVFLRYDDLLTQWRGPVDRAQAALGLSFPRLSETAALEIESFLSAGLHHQRAAPAAVTENSGLSQWLRETYVILDGWARQGENAADTARLDAIRGAFDTAAPAFARPIVSGQAAAAGRRKAEQDVAALRGELTERDTRLAALERDRAAEARELADLRGRLAQSESALAQRRHEAEQSAGELAAAQHELRALKAARAEYDHLLAAYKEQLALLSAHEAERQAAMAALEERSRLEIEAKDAALTALRRETDSVRASLDAAHKAVALVEHQKQEAAEAAEQAAADRQAAEARLQEQLGEIASLAQMLQDIEAAAALQAEQAREDLVAAHQAKADADREAAGARAALERAEEAAAQAVAQAVAQATREAKAAADREVASARTALETARQAAAKAEREKKQAADDAQKAKAEKQATEARLKERFDEIAALTKMVRGSEATDHKLRQSMAAVFAANGTPALVPETLWRPLALRRQVALLKRSGLFDADWYLKANADVAKAGVDPFEHFVRYGAKEGRAPNEAFGQLRDGRK